MKKKIEEMRGWAIPVLAAGGGAVGAFVLQALLSASATTVTAGLDAQAEEQIKTVVEDMLKTDGGLTYAKALDDHMKALNGLTLQLGDYIEDQRRTRDQFDQFQIEYREDQRIIQAALRELATEGG
jgi:citrate lyase beta subunit